MKCLLCFRIFNSFVEWDVKAALFLGAASAAGWLGGTAAFQLDTHMAPWIALPWKQWGNSLSKCPPGTEHISPELKSLNKGAFQCLSKTLQPTHKMSRAHLQAGGRRGGLEQKTGGRESRKPISVYLILQTRLQSRDWSWAERRLVQTAHRLAGRGALGCVWMEQREVSGSQPLRALSCSKRISFTEQWDRDLFL